VNKDGFANYYFNKLERDELLKAFRAQGDFSAVPHWTIEGDVKYLKGLKDTPKIRAEIFDEKSADGKSSQTAVTLEGFSGVKLKVAPLSGKNEVADLQEPAGSGGLALALYQYHRFLSFSEKEFANHERHFHHGGHEPYYPPNADGKAPKSLRDLRQIADVLRDEATFRTKWYFSPKDRTLVAFEVRATPESDPCEVYLSDYRKVDGRVLPHEMRVRYGNDHFCTFTISGYKLAAAK